MRGQVTQEFMLSISTYLLIVIVLVGLAMFQLTMLAQTDDRLKADQASSRVGNVINYVYLAGENASYNLTFAKGPYGIIFNERYIAFESERTIRDFGLLTDRINATAINSSEITVRNINGVIQIEEH